MEKRLLNNSACARSLSFYTGLLAAVEAWGRGGEG